MLLSDSPLSHVILRSTKVVQTFVVYVACGCAHWEGWIDGLMSPCNVVVIYFGFFLTWWSNQFYYWLDFFGYSIYFICKEIWHTNHLFLFQFSPIGHLANFENYWLVEKETYARFVDACFRVCKFSKVGYTMGQLCLYQNVSYKIKVAMKFNQNWFAVFFHQTTDIDLIHSVSTGLILARHCNGIGPMLP